MTKVQVLKTGTKRSEHSKIKVIKKLGIRSYLQTSLLKAQTVQGKHNFRFHLSYIAMVFHKGLHSTVKNGITFVVGLVSSILTNTHTAESMNIGVHEATVLCDKGSLNRTHEAMILCDKGSLNRARSCTWFHSVQPPRQAVAIATSKTNYRCLLSNSASPCSVPPRHPCWSVPLSGTVKSWGPGGQPPQKPAAEAGPFSAC